MSAPIPPRFSLSPLSFSRVLLVFLTGLVPAVLILLSPLPFWLRIWLWIPVLGTSVAMVLGRLEGRSLAGLLSSAWSFARRKRQRVWMARADEFQEEVVASPPWRVSAWAGELARRMKRLAEAAVVHGIVTGIALGIAFILAVTMRWVAVRVLAPPDTSQPAYALDTEKPPPASYTPPTPVPATPPIPTPSPAPTAAPTPTPVVWVHEREWDVLALPGYLVLDNKGSGACSLQLSAPGWDYTVAIPASEVGKLLVVPLLQPQTTGRMLTIRSSCELEELEAELVAYRPWCPQRSRLWLVPVCSPPGRVRIRPHDRQVSVTLLDLAGETVAGPVDVPLTGAWAPQAPAGGCWLYRVESEELVWLEVMVFAWP